VSFHDFIKPKIIKTFQNTDSLRKLCVLLVIPEVSGAVIIACHMQNDSNFINEEWA